MPAEYLGSNIEHQIQITCFIRMNFAPQISHSNGLFDVSYPGVIRFSSFTFPLRLLISWSLVWGWVWVLLSFFDDDDVVVVVGTLWAGLYIGTNAAGLWKPPKLGTKTNQLILPSHSLADIPIQMSTYRQYSWFSDSLNQTVAIIYGY